MTDKTATSAEEQAGPNRYSGPASLFDLSGRVAVVTGGSRGLGRAIAEGFAAAGATVVIASRKADACQEVADAIRSKGGTASACPTHVGRPDEVTALVDHAVAEHGGIDILVNCAANALGGPVTDLTPDAFDSSFRANVAGPMLLASAALPHLQASGRGAVINVISVGAFAGAAYLGLYTASKAALWNVTRTMAKEWGPLGVRVNALAPGPFDTDMMAGSLAIPEFHEQIVDSTILKRVADPAELVGPALLLASDAGSYMTGSCLVVDGGTSA